MQKAADGNEGNCVEGQDQRYDWIGATSHPIRDGQKYITEVLYETKQHHSSKKNEGQKANEYRIHARVVR